ncbi:MAG: phosphoribosylformylglycinamidine synthase subunit PurQ [Treponema sp.]|jgi:phosphoribosylformylglycinamidine synthase|nr:phosphoribosylformylglycinamidine synthase subunit PurQ [Treponema sp.]
MPDRDIFSNDKVFVHRVFVEKKAGFDVEARRLHAELAGFLGARYPALARLGGLRIFHRYDVAGLTAEQFRLAVNLVLSEPQCDRVSGASTPSANTPSAYPPSADMSSGEMPVGPEVCFFGIEYLPGQYDQRADSAEQCIELAVGVKPMVRTARFYALEAGELPLSEDAVEAVKRYLINPVDSREAPRITPASREALETENPAHPARIPPDVPVLEGFRAAGEAALGQIRGNYGLAMSGGDLLFCQAYFRAENRDPTLTELRVLDTYWSDHCRHTTFTTVLENIAIEDSPPVQENGFVPPPGAGGAGAAALGNALARYEEARKEVYGWGAETPRTLMDMAVIGARVLKKRGLLPDLDESGEINACTVRIEAEFAEGALEPGSEESGSREPSSFEPWLLLFKNETHNHPTEIEPFGGAATCLGGAIRDPLSGRAFVYQAMRLTGGGDPRQSLAETLPGKLPQIKIAREAAAGYASYGNQIGLATGQVAEFYHPGFTAKRMELGAVIGAVPRAWVRREEPEAGDLVLLVGGKTGRDGIGGATGSSKVHTGESVETSGAEVQKGNAVEERKLQRFFRNPALTRLIKRCNDFGAGGVSVAVGELADGLDINLDAVPRKYAGLDGTELAISESQERMAVVVAPSDADAFIRRAAEENLTAVVIAEITGGQHDGINGILEDKQTQAALTPGKPVEGPRLRMFWQGRLIADLSREFLNTNGAPRSASARIIPGRRRTGGAKICPGVPEQELRSLRSGSRRGLQERFDGSIGASSVLFPWGGRTQGTPECGMAALLPSLDKESRTASLMTFGYDPDLSERNPYEGAKGAVREALAKFVCLGGQYRKARLSLQEYFERADSPEAWGKPAAALLGALEAQLALEVPAIGGKDSMSGTYRDEAGGITLTVPPTLAVFAAGTAPARSIRSGVLSGEAGNLILLLDQTPAGGLSEGEDEWDRFKANMAVLEDLGRRGLVKAAYPVGPGGIAATLAVMAFGNMTGLEVHAGIFALAEGDAYQGSVLVELAGESPAGRGVIAARTLKEPVYRILRELRFSPVKGEAEPEGNLIEESSLAALRRAYESPLAQVYPQTSSGLTVAETDGLGPDGRPERQAGTQPAHEPLESLKSGIPEAGRPVSGSRLIIPEYHQGGLRKTRRIGMSGPKEGAKPLVVLPVFPGTNCEWDMERAFRKAGGRIRPVVFRNRNREDILESTAELAAAIREAQILALSGGFSAGDEPDGSGKFIANVFRSPEIADALSSFLNDRDGLVLGICNGFQALIKLGLVPYGTCRPADKTMPTLTFNRIGRHVSRMVRTRVMSNLSPWLALEEPGAVHVIPVSHGEGRIVMREEEAEALFRAGQVPFCYADEKGEPAMKEPDNPNGSDFAIESLTSPDGRVLGKMSHSERCGEYVHINIPGNKQQRLFEAGVGYFG